MLLAADLALVQARNSYEPGHVTLHECKICELSYRSPR
jgi:hypothetical protein